MIEKACALLESDRYAMPRWQAEILVGAVVEARTLRGAQTIARKKGCPLGGIADRAMHEVLEMLKGEIP